MNKWLNDWNVKRKKVKDFKKYMAAIDDLNAKVTALGTSAANAIAAAKAAIATAGSANDAAIETAVTNLGTIQSSLDSFTASPTT
jgi:hypothetical protein